MSRHEELGTQEAAEYRPHSEILRYITDDKDVDETTSKDFRVLDWGYGCGRGRLVEHLLMKGIEAYGADIDPEIIKTVKIIL
jgi:2-polyprenyl-3-methyl-5-hydroxy-6-metoxy-1,4-benzoquinol methylase